MNVMKRKLKSERGASITWALLIFLVCAVVGSAVLVAGTASAGRMSKLGENEQRYYSVTSMAELLRDVLGQQVAVTRVPSPDGDNPPATYVDDKNATFNDNVIKALINEMMDWIGTDSYWDKDNIAIKNPLTIPLEIRGGTGLSDAVSGAKASLTLYPDGTITADVSKDGFAMRLSFSMQRTSSSNASGGAETKTDTFYWVLTEARTVDSKDKA